MRNEKINTCFVAEAAPAVAYIEPERVDIYLLVIFTLLSE